MTARTPWTTTGAAASGSSTSAPRTRRPADRRNRVLLNPGVQIARPDCPHGGILWTIRGTPCHALSMDRAGVALVSRRHVDLGRMSSAICPAG
ncbi:putative leader peptide [Streptomyces sp. CMB-StM0423]|uniref:putative leader peptide n=1 Tax=Streptomyces sp. CMB-StM0423 TaxID=2059884 RepID=UPI003FA3AEA8